MEKWVTSWVTKSIRSTTSYLSYLKHQLGDVVSDKFLGLLILRTIIPNKLKYVSYIPTNIWLDVEKYPVMDPYIQHLLMSTDLLKFYLYQRINTSVILYFLGGDVKTALPSIIDMLPQSISVDGDIFSSTVNVHFDYYSDIDVRDIKSPFPGSIRGGFGFIINLRQLIQQEADNFHSLDHQATVEIRINNISSLDFEIWYKIWNIPVPNYMNKTEISSVIVKMAEIIFNHIYMRKVLN